MDPSKRCPKIRQPNFPQKNCFNLPIHPVVVKISRKSRKFCKPSRQRFLECTKMSAKNFQRLQDSNKTRTLIRLATVSQSTLIGPNRILWTLEKLNVGTALVLSTVWPLVLFSVAQVALVRLTTLISAYFIFNDRFGHVEKAT